MIYGSRIQVRHSWRSLSIVVIYQHGAVGLPGVLVVKNLPASAGDIGDMSSIPELGRSPGEGDGNPL